jgi:hypothetical protein
MKKLTKEMMEKNVGGLNCAGAAAGLVAGAALLMIFPASAIAFGAWEVANVSVLLTCGAEVFR